MGPWARRLRRGLNPVSTGLTAWWLGVGRRQVGSPAATGARPSGDEPRPEVFFSVPSPGEWTVPAGQRPGWDWLPEHGASPDLRAMSRWVRLWFRLPFVDRYAYEWMWWHGGWAVHVPGPPPPGEPEGGVREPLRPRGD